MSLGSSGPKVALFSDRCQIAARIDSFGFTMPLNSPIRAYGSCLVLALGWYGHTGELSRYNTVLQHHLGEDDRDHGLGHDASRLHLIRRGIDPDRMLENSGASHPTHLLIGNNCNRCGERAKPPT